MTTSPDDFEALVARHQGAVCAIAYAVLRDRGLSEEIAQEAFLVAWQKLPGMHPAPTLPGWVCGIARNLARNAARRRRPEAEMIERPDPTTALDTLLSREASDLANRALAELSDVERDAIVLYYRGDESLGAVAAALGITEAAAKKRVLRGRDHLRTALAAVEGTLRTTRPGPAFTLGCVAALAVAGARSAAAGAIAGKSPAADAGAAKAAAGAGAAASVAARFAVRPAAVIVAGSTIAVVVGLGAWAAVRGDATTPPASPAPVAAERTRMGARKITPAEHATRVAQLAATAPSLAVEPRIYDFAGSSLFEQLPPLPPPTPGPIGKRELRAAVGTVQPFIRECFERSGEPRHGALELYLRLEGDTSTIATDARLDGAHAANAALAECVRETLLSVELPDLDVGGTVDVFYPFSVDAS